MPNTLARCILLISATSIHLLHCQTSYSSSNYIAYSLLAAQEPNGWLLANEFCDTNHGTTLATILNTADQAEMVSLLSLLPGGVTDSMWIGWADWDGSKQWQPCINSCASNWMCNAGDELGASWHESEATWDPNKCGVIKSNTGALGKWFDVGCMANLDLICNHPNGIYKDARALNYCGAPTKQPTNPPTKRPTNNPTKRPTNRPTIPPTTKRPTKQPTKRPTVNPTKRPTPSPTQSPSASTKAPTTKAPTASPSPAPSNAPTQPPTNAPTGSPTACVMYNDPTSLIDGVDSIQSANMTNYYKNKISFDDQMTMFNDGAVSKYIGVGSDIFFEETITCNKTHSNVCYIGCYYTGFCAYASIIPNIYGAYGNNNTNSTLIMSCDHKKACTAAAILVDADTQLENITILCSASLSCDAMEVSINSSFSTDLKIDCNEILSCHKLTVHLFGNTIEKEDDTLTLSITCFEGSSCAKMSIYTDDSLKINLTLTMHQFSHKVFISYEHYKNIHLNCGFEDDHRYIRYSSTDPMDTSELLRVARLEYPNTLKLPCEDITVDCTGHNVTDFDRECQFDYFFSSAFDLSTILSSGRNCFWVDIMPLFQPKCIGTCDERMRYYAHNVSFAFHVLFQTENDTKMQQICNGYFNNTNVTTKTLNDIDAIFDYVLTVSKGLTRDKNTIHNVLKSPQTQSQLFEEENITAVYCNDMEAMLFALEPLELSTDLRIESTIENEDELFSLFSTDSTFIKQSEALIADLFGVPVTITSYLSVVTNSKYIPKKYKVYGIVIAVAAFIVIAILIAVSYHYFKQNKLKKLQREKDIIRMKYPMVIAIAIGVYDWSIYRNLDVDIDIRTVSILCDLFRYKMYPPYKKGKSCKLYWKQKEILTFLKKKAMHFNEEVIKGKYDGLIVVMSGHGIKDYIVSSDCHKIEKQAIHRLFSKKYVDARTVPRIFIFDSCSGADDKNPVPREFDSDDDEGNTEGLDTTANKPNTEEKETDDREQTKAVTKPTNLEKSKTVKLEETFDQWRGGENNPDYGLVTIFAANAGFQAKMDSITGSYLISQFVQRVISNMESGNKLLLGEIFDLIQSDLHEKGKQQTVNTFNNKTRCIKMVRKQQEDEKKDKSEPLLVINPDSKKRKNIKKKQSKKKKKTKENDAGSAKEKKKEKTKENDAGSAKEKENGKKEAKQSKKSGNKKKKKKDKMDSLEIENYRS